MEKWQSMIEKKGELHNTLWKMISICKEKKVHLCTEKNGGIRTKIV